MESLILSDSMVIAERRIIVPLIIHFVQSPLSRKKYILDEMKKIGSNPFDDFKILKHVTDKVDYSRIIGFNGFEGQILKPNIHADGSVFFQASGVKFQSVTFRDDLRFPVVQRNGKYQIIDGNGYPLHEQVYSRIFWEQGNYWGVNSEKISKIILKPVSYRNKQIVFQISIC